MLLSVGLLILSRSLVPVAGILAVVGLLAVAVVLRIRGGHVALDVSLQATAWLLIALVIIWTVARAVFEPGRITYHRVVGAILLYLTIGLVFVALYTLVGAVLAQRLQRPDRRRARVAAERPRLFQLHDAHHRGYGDIVPVDPGCAQPQQHRSHRRAALSGDPAGPAGIARTATGGIAGSARRQAARLAGLRFDRRFLQT